MKEKVCITVDSAILERAREQRVCISACCEAALVRECEIFERSNYARALEKQNSVFKEFIKGKNLETEWENFKYGLVQQKANPA